MSIKSITTATLLSLTLGACAISVGDGIDDSHHDYRDRLSIKLPNGDRARFSCPEGLSAFVERNEDSGKLTYGCTTDSDRKDQ